MIALLWIPGTLVLLATLLVVAALVEERFVTARMAPARVDDAAGGAR